MQKHSFDAVIFDLDGVITQTAVTHAEAWKMMFDDYLKDREKRFGEPFQEFTHAGDYLPFVDGKPRYQGVEAFFKSRGIDIPFGKPSDHHDKETICGLGNRKNIAFNEILQREGAKVYKSTVQLIKELKQAGVKLGVASSSKNCKQVLESVDLLHFFETRVDGEVSAELGLKGKPEPDIFTVAADNLNVYYDRAVIVEDAVSGVMAGSKGNFGLIIGIARENNRNELLSNGADIVFNDLEELGGIAGINNWFEKGLADDMWSLTYRDYIPEKERSREALLTIGNGLFATRGAPEEVDNNEINYPGTYMAGVYNKLGSTVGDRIVENEDFVNVPNWLLVSFKIDNGRWFNINKTKIVSIERKLDLRQGLLNRTVVVSDEKERLTQILSQRFVSMHDPNIAAITYSVKPLNYSAKITVRSGLNADLINDGVERYSELNQAHLKGIGQDGQGELSWILAETTQSGIKIAQAATIKVFHNRKLFDPGFRHKIIEGRVDTSFTVNLKENDELYIEKNIAITNTIATGIDDPVTYVKRAVKKTGCFNALLKESKKEWDKIWSKTDIKLEGDRLSQKLLRLHNYHLMVTCSPHNRNIDFGIPARGLHGEAYRGHIFWDELYILPLYSIRFPEIAKSVLLYRYRRLNLAKRYAKEHGFKGAMYPWQSGSSGEEETQVVHLNPVSGEWGDDYSSLQRHISLAVAYNIWFYFHATSDNSFMESYGAEILLEISRFWTDKAGFNKKTGKYEIAGIMGPDEFHEKYPGAKSGGVKDNAYTNLMVVWLLRRVFDLLKQMPEKESNKLLKRLSITPEDLNLWKTISQNINLTISDKGIISQFDGYFDLKELDWDHYKNKYENIYRMDRILKAEGLSPDSFKLSKQADTLMTFYNLEKIEVDKIIVDLGHNLPENYLQENFDYYISRCSHGSTLSRVVHSYVANLTGNKDLAWELYNEALQSDYNDIQGGTTAEGIHAGVMGGTVFMVISSFCGVKFLSDQLVVKPSLPKHWRSVCFGIIYRGREYSFTVNQKNLTVKSGSETQSFDFKESGSQYIIRT